MKSAKVLFYCDSWEYGGHEVMALEAVEYLASKRLCIIDFAFYEKNEKLGQRLARIRNSYTEITLHPLKFRTKRLQPLRTLASPEVNRITGFMKSVNPDIVLVVQGRIEIGSLGLLAAKRAGLYAISYIPMAHPVSTSGKRLLAGTRERVNRYFYGLPDKIITVSESARQMLLARGAKAEIVVVQNGIHKRSIETSERRKFREHYGIRADEYVVAVIGRIDFAQKGQDFAIDAIAHFRSQLPNYRFIFAGRGPDEKKLIAMIEKSHLQPTVRHLGWTDNPIEIYAVIDMLLIPSKFEGVPLVMLEAMSHKLPIVASNVDGMAELLPREWLFPYGDRKALVDTLVTVRGSAVSALLEIHRNQVETQHQIEEFCARFSSAVLENCMV